MAAGTRAAAAKLRYVDHTERVLHLATCIALSGHGEAVAAMTTMARAFRADAALWAVHKAYQGPSGRTHLMHAARTGNEARAAFLLAQGASASQATKLGCEALMCASEGGHLRLARLLVDLGRAPLDAAKAGDGMTALMYACSSGRLEVARFLVERGASRSATTSSGATALTLATFGSHFQVVALLARHGTAEGYCCLTVEASAGGQLCLVRCLVEEWGAAANAARPPDGATALTAASELGHLETVRYLVEHGGAAVDAARASDGSTALTLACENGDIPVARCLLEQGHADANLARADGRTPLMLASAAGNLPHLVPLGPLAGYPQVTHLVSLLLEHFADKKALDNAGNRASSFARAYPFCRRVRKLLV